MPFATDIIDVRTQNPLSAGSGDVGNNAPVAIISGLSKPTHQRTLPTLLLYSETGLRIYDELTIKAAEYYLFGAEEEILKKHGDEIARAMHSRGCIEGESVVELGAGQVISSMQPVFPYWDAVPDEKSPNLLKQVAQEDLPHPPRLVSLGRHEKFLPVDNLPRPRSRETGTRTHTLRISDL